MSSLKLQRQNYFKIPSHSDFQYGKKLSTQNLAKFLSPSVSTFGVTDFKTDKYGLHTSAMSVMCIIIFFQF
jgi:hypothetical protein